MNYRRSDNGNSSYECGRFDNAAQIAYIHGRIESQLEGFASSLNLPARELTQRVGALLIGLPSGEPMGFTQRVRDVRSDAAARDEEQPLAVDGRTRPNTRWRTKSGQLMTPAQRKREAKRRLAARAGQAGAVGQASTKPISGPKSYWARMSPEQRSREVKRRMAVAQKRALRSPLNNKNSQETS